jgi:DNA-binding GntR family transcriptional regulator
MTDIFVRTTMTETLVSQLRTDIRAGTIAPGSRLRQGEVAARFGISTTPVREAFAALEREGLLVGSPHRGMIVFHPSIEDLQENYEIRIPLETLATEKAVANITDEEVVELEGIVDAMREATSDAERYTALNRRFHGVIYHAARLPKLERLIADLRDASNAYQHIYATIAPTARDTQADHEAIFDAVKARDARRAAAAMTVHLKRTVEQVTRGLQQDPSAPALS